MQAHAQAGRGAIRNVQLQEHRRPAQSGLHACSSRGRDHFAQSDVDPLNEVIRAQDRGIRGNRPTRCWLHAGPAARGGLWRRCGCRGRLRARAARRVHGPDIDRGPQEGGVYGSRAHRDGLHAQAAARGRLHHRHAAPRGEAKRDRTARRRLHSGPAQGRGLQRTRPQGGGLQPGRHA